MKKYNIKYFFIVFILFIYSLFNIGGSSFVINKEIDIKNISISNGDKAVCYNNSTGIKYTDINKALSVSSSGQEIIVYIGSNIFSEKNIIIPSGRTLTIPFLGKSSNPSAVGNNISNTTMYKIDSADDRNKYGNTLGDVNSVSVAKYRSIVLNMRNGADIIVNGTLNLGGVASPKGSNGYYSEINLGAGSSITCNSGSIFNCYGYVKENFDDAVHEGMENYKNIIDNSLDSERFIVAKSGSRVNTLLALYDVLSAGPLTGMVAAEKCPFNVFDFQCLQSFSKFEYGCKMYGTVIVEGPNSMNVMKEVCLISSNSNESALLYLHSGALNIEYKPNDVRYSSRNLNINNFNLVVNGNMSIGYLYFSEYNGQIKLDTRKFHLPFSSKVSIYVLDGFTFNISKKVKFLMGSKLVIKEGGVVNVNESTAFYNSQIAPEYNPGLGIYYDSTGKNDAELICNGLLKINSDSNNLGCIGAYITHNSLNNNGKLDFKSISSPTNLSAIVQEGTSNTIVTVTSSGLFYDNTNYFNAQFTSGTEYTTDHNEDNYFWNGTYISTYTVNVTFDETILNPVFDYTIKLSEQSNGSSSFNSELTNMRTSGSTSISNGIYMNISVNNAVSVTLTKNSSESITYNSSQWIYVNGNFDIYIVPSEGVKVSLNVFKDPKFNDNEDKWSQGTGHTYFYIEESSQLNGTYTRTMDLKCSSFTFFVKKGNYFKVGYYWDQSDTVIGASGLNGFTGNNRISTNNPTFAPQPTTEWVNNTTSSKSGAFLAGNNNTSPGLEYTFELGYYSGHALASGCITEDTLVMMTNGTYKKAIDIRSGDLVMSVNHETGNIEPAPVVFNDHIDGKASNYNVISLEFSNNKKVEVVFEHGFFDLDTMQYEYINEDNYDKLIGHRFVTIDYIDGKAVKNSATLTKAYIEEKNIRICSPITYKNLNIVTENMLSIAGDIIGLFNIFEYDDNLAYDPIKKQNDINNYGLLDYSYFNNSIPYEVYEAFNGQYLQVAMAKGILTEEMLNKYIEHYLPIISEQTNNR